MGVTRIVLIQAGGFGFDNSYMLRAIAEHPGVFSGVAVVDSTAATVEDEMRRQKKQGVRGFRITPGKDPAGWLDTPGMTAMWKRAARERMAMCPLVNPDALAAIDRACVRHPDTRVVIDHIARIGATGTIRDEDVRALCALARHKHVFVKLSAFYALGKKTYPYLDLAPMIRQVYETFGPRRLMWATDAPYQTMNGHTYAGSLELIRDRLGFIRGEDRDWVLTKTASSVFF